jgi:undecaprenyl-diphosphatase
VLALTVGVLALRVGYLIWICPYELVADEAQYWVWSKHLDLSYYSKGPGVAWAIWASTSVFGDSEWAVRLPVALAAAVAMWALARFATDSSGGDARVGFLAAAMFCLVPGYQGAAQLMTIDGPFITCWILAVLFFSRVARGQPGLWNWLALAVALGVGFLFKYTTLLLIPGLVAFALIERRRVNWDAKLWRRLGVAVAVFLVVISPVLIWNYRHGWPTVAHLLGHVGAQGGDLAVKPWSYNPVWTLKMIGGQAGIIGPLLVLMGVGAWRSRWSLAVWAGLPVLLFYVVVSFVTDVEANWMLAGYATLIIPAAQLVVENRTRFVRSVWIAGLVYGIIAVTGLMFPQLVARMPVVGRLVPMHRIAGHRAEAVRVNAVIEREREKSGQEPAIVASSYGRASLLAYYLPGHPVAHSAASWLGGRRSSHDFFADTMLSDEKLTARPVILYGAKPSVWTKAFEFEKITAADSSGPVLIGYGYRGRTSP